MNVSRHIWLDLYASLGNGQEQSMTNPLLRVLDRFLEDVTRPGFGAMDIGMDSPIMLSRGLKPHSLGPERKCCMIEQWLE